MNNFIKQVIDETFSSKKQRNHWKKWTKDFSDKTDDEKIEQDVDEVVDENGDMISGGEAGDAKTKGITSKSTTDKVVTTGTGMIGTFGIGGVTNTSNTLKYWTEADMSKSLGYEDTLGQDADYEQAKDHFEDELGLPDGEAEERIEKMGYDPKLPKGKVRLIENPKIFIEEYLDEILIKKNKASDIVKKDTLESEKKNINPIIKKQMNSLKQTLKDNNLTVKDITEYLEGDDE